MPQAKNASRIASFAGILLICLAGCEEASNRKFDPIKDFREFRTHLDYSLERQRSPMDITDVKLLDVIEVTDDVVRLNYLVTGKFVRSAFMQIDRAAALKRLGWDEDAVQQAAKRLRVLPAGDAAPAEQLNPLSSLPSNFFRSDSDEGVVRHFEGSCSARRRATKWAFENYDMKLVDSEKSAIGDVSLDTGVALTTSLPPDSMVINTDHGKATVQAAVSRMKDFFAAVDAVEKTVLEREQRLYQTLQSAVKKGNAWIYPIAMAGKPPISWKIDVVGSGDDGGLVRVLIRHPTDENLRRVFEGHINRAVIVDRGPYHRPERIPPQIVLHQAGAGPSLFYVGDEQLRIVMDADDTTLRMFTNTTNAVLLAGTNDKSLPSETAAHAQLLERLTPGAQWTGSVTMEIGNYESVIFTVTNRKEDGSYLRVVAESVNDPYTIAVFEGTFNKSHVYGWPIVLRATHSAIGETKLFNFFRSDAPDLPYIALAMQDSGFVGSRGNDKIFLTATRQLEPWSERLNMVRQLFSQGASFKGRLQERHETKEIVLTIAEIRNDGDYIRVIAQLANEPQEIAIYEGRLRKEPEFIDGYSVELQKRQPGTTSGKVFDRSQGTTLSLRLALDNSAVYGVLSQSRNHFTETMKLTRQPSNSEGVSMATNDFAAMIRQKLIKGVYFRGALKDIENKRTLETTMRVMEANGDGITVELTSSGRAGGGRAVYQGILRLDDLAVNGYCILLNKVEGTKPPANPRASFSPTAIKTRPTEIFDEVVGKTRTLRLAFSPDGEVLLGIGGNEFSNRMDEKGELLTLRPVSTNKPLSLKKVPIASAPNMPVLSTAGFRQLGETTSARPLIKEPDNQPSFATKPVATGVMPVTSTAVASTATANSQPGTDVKPTSPPVDKSPSQISAAELRTWHSSDGKFSVYASLVETKESVVVLKRADGQIVEVPIARLSDADREFCQLRLQK